MIEVTYTVTVAHPRRWWKDDSELVDDLKTVIEDGLGFPDPDEVPISVTVVKQEPIA